MKPLPQPDEHYDYWLGSSHTEGPAILHSRLDDKWFLLVGDAEGFLFDGKALKRFDNPRSAYKELEKVLEK
jgi:hypothetical protein